MAFYATRVVFLAALSITLLSLHQCEASEWISGGAWFYGELNGSAADAGACGYKNVTKLSGYGLNTAAVSWFLWDNAAVCGACYEVKCDVSKTTKCKSNNSAIVTVTNFCPDSTPGGFCSWANASISLTKKVFTDIIDIPPSTPWIPAPIKLRRVNCTKPGFVKFRIVEGTTSNFLMISIYNVAGAGSIQAVEISFNGGKSWTSMYRNWGSNWSLNDGNAYNGKPFSFRLTAKATKEVVTAVNVVPAKWFTKAIYTSAVNFKLAPP